MVVAKVIFEMLGSPKEHIEGTIKKYVDNIEKEYKNIRLLDSYISEAEETEDKLWSLFAEVEIRSSPEDLAWFCIDYMPASVEIVEPSEISFKLNDYNAFMNDLLAKLHNIGSNLKQLSIKNELITKNGLVLMRNLIALILKEGPKKLEELSKNTGVPEKDLEKFLETLKKEGKIKETGGRFSLKKK